MTDTRWVYVAGFLLGILVGFLVNELRWQDKREDWEWISGLKDNAEWAENLVVAGAQNYIDTVRKEHASDEEITAYEETLAQLVDQLAEARQRLYDESEDYT